jgi:hypothetical protein
MAISKNISAGSTGQKTNTEHGGHASSEDGGNNHLQPNKKTRCCGPSRAVSEKNTRTVMTSIAKQGSTNSEAERANLTEHPRRRRFEARPRMPRSHRVTRWLSSLSRCSRIGARFFLNQQGLANDSPFYRYSAKRNDPTASRLLHAAPGDARIRSGRAAAECV